MQHCRMQLLCRLLQASRATEHLLTSIAPLSLPLWLLPSASCLSLLTSSTAANKMQVLQFALHKKRPVAAAAHALQLRPYRQATSRRYVQL
jgi:hypothetical protein